MIIFLTGEFENRTSVDGRPYIDRWTNVHRPRYDRTPTEIRSYTDRDTIVHRPRYDRTPTEIRSYTDRDTIVHRPMDDERNGGSEIFSMGLGKTLNGRRNFLKGLFLKVSNEEDTILTRKNTTWLGMEMEKEERKTYICNEFNKED